MNVCLVTSPRFNCKPVTKSVAPTGLACLGAVARQAGHNVVGIEALIIGNPKTIAERVAASEPDVVATSTCTIDRFAGIKTIRAIRRALPKAFIVVGGSHFSQSAEDALRCVKEIDAVVVGEGEITFTELLDRLPGREALSEVDGLVFRDADGQIVRNRPRELMDDINHLPMPAWDLFDAANYSLSMIDRDSTTVAGVITTRGCPFSCVYCANSVKTKIRFLDPAKAVDQMQWQQKTFGVKAFDILNDNIMVDKSHVVGMCEEMLRRNCGFTWWAEARASKLDAEVLTLMKRAGCKCLTFGIETGTDEVLRACKKNITTAQMFEAMETVAKIGFDQVGMGLIIGLPGETIETIDRSVVWLNSIRKVLGPAWNRKTVLGQLPLMHPGTELSEIGVAEGSLPENFSWNSPYLEPKRYLPLINSRYESVPHFASRSLPLETICSHIKNRYWADS